MRVTGVRYLLSSLDITPLRARQQTNLKPLLSPPPDWGSLRCPLLPGGVVYHPPYCIPPRVILCVEGENVSPRGGELRHLRYIRVQSTLFSYSYLNPQTACFSTVYWRLIASIFCHPLPTTSYSIQLHAKCGCVVNQPSIR